MTTYTKKYHITNFKPLGNQHFLNLALNWTQKEIIFGMLLGDLYLQTQNKGKTYWLWVQQSYKHKDYVLHLFELFKPFCSSEPDIVYWPKNKTIDIRFQTRGHVAFSEFGKMFYDGVKKHLPSKKEINDLLTPIALSYWFMDDGGIDGANPKGCSINTHGFSDLETEILIDILKKKYNLIANSIMNKGKKIIVISAKSCHVFNAIVKSHTIKSMYYKLPGHNKKMT